VKWANKQLALVEMSIPVIGEIYEKPSMHNHLKYGSLLDLLSCIAD
jgi:hypothetical protein